MERTTFIKKLIFRISALLFVMSTIVGWFKITPDRILLKLDTICTQQEILLRLTLYAFCQNFLVQGIEHSGIAN